MYVVASLAAHGRPDFIHKFHLPVYLWGLVTLRPRATPGAITPQLIVEAPAMPKCAARRTRCDAHDAANVKNKYHMVEYQM